MFAWGYFFEVTLVRRSQASQDPDRVISFVRLCDFLFLYKGILLHDSTTNIKHFLVQESQHV